MSYVIVYDRQVIKTTNGYTFAVLHGDNNVWEANNKRRCRDWNCWILNQPENKVYDYFKGWCGKTYQEHFQYGSKFLNDEELMRWVKNGIKNARTIEEIITLKPFASLHCYITIYNKNIDWGNPGYCKIVEDAFLKTTEAFEEWIKKAEEIEKNKSDKEAVYVTVGFSDRNPLRLGAKRTPCGKVVIKYKNQYISEISTTGWTADSDASKAMVFDNADKALDFIKNNRGRYIMKIISYDNFLKNQNVERNFVISLSTSARGKFGYYVKGTKGGVQHTYTRGYAKRFSESEAKRTLERLSKRNFYDVIFDVEKVANA